MPRGHKCCIGAPRNGRVTKEPRGSITAPQLFRYISVYVWRGIVEAAEYDFVVRQLQAPAVI